MIVGTVTLNPALDREFIIQNFCANSLHRIYDRDKINMDPGGKGINVSMMLASLGIPSTAMGFIGGYIGRVISEELRKRYRSITVNFVHMEEESRENISIFDEEKHTITEINAPGPQVSEDDLQHFLKRYHSFCSHSNLILISGSVPLGIPLNIYGTLSQIAQERNNSVFMEARGKLLTQSSMQACPMVVRPDMRSDQKILGQHVECLDDYFDAGKELIRRGAQLVVISYKTLQDVIVTREGNWVFSIRDEEVDFSHLLGTGDAFMAGMIYYYLKRKQTEALDYLKMAHFGMASALAKTHRIKKEMPPVEEINQTMDHIAIERMN